MGMEANSDRWATDSPDPRRSPQVLQQTEGYPFNPRKWAAAQRGPQPWLDAWWTSTCSIIHANQRPASLEATPRDIESLAVGQ